MANETIQHHHRVLRSWGLSVNLRLSSSDAVAQRQILFYALFFLCIVVALTYLPALSARATFLDDHQYVMDNPLVQNPSWRSVRHFFTEVWRPSTVRGYYQPLTMLSFMTDYYLSGPKDMIRSCHRTSLVLHLANMVLLAILLFVLFGQPLIAAGVALLFALHPITIEQVCWIAERKTVLATFFALMSLIAYVRYARDPRQRHYIGCIVAYILALLSKPIVVPLPMMMVLLDYWPLNRVSRRSVTEKIPLLTLGVIFAVITYISQSRAAVVHLPGDYNPWHVPLILCHNIVFYLYKLFWPLNLLAYYDSPSPLSLNHPMVLIGVTGTVIIVLLLMIARRWTCAPLTGGLIFLVMIFPAMGILRVTPTIAANRYAYLPATGLFLVLAAALVWLTQTRRADSFAVRYTGVVLLLVLLAGLEAAVSRSYLSQWRDTIHLHEYMLGVAPHSPLIHGSLGTTLERLGETERAIGHYRASLTEAPDSMHTRYNLAVALAGLPGKTKEAMQEYEQVADANSAFALQANLNLGSLHLEQGHIPEALHRYRMALNLQGGFPIGRRNLGRLLIMTGETKAGLKHLREAVRIAPGILSAVKDLGWFLATHPDEAIRDPNEALEYAKKAVAITHGRNAATLDVLAAAYACDGQYDKAIDTAQQALAIAKRLRNDELAAEIEERLRLYDMSVPYLEAPRVRLDRLLAKAKERQQEAGIDPGDKVQVTDGELTEH